MNSNFFHKVLKELKARNVSGRTLLVAVSGGVDSMLLLEILQAAQPILQVKLLVAHIHHGFDADPKHVQFRDQARQFVMHYCHERDLEYLENEEAPHTILRSEQEYREFRYSWLRQFLVRVPGALLVLGHHLDDLLETRMIRLIRGTGAQGLHGMELYKGELLRPFLHMTRAEIEAEAQRLKLKWVEDPSNKIKDPLRNWLREEWLSSLESKRPGSVRALGQSLQLIVEALQSPPEGVNFSAFVSQDGILRAELVKLPLEQQKQAVAFYFRSIGISGYGKNHVFELLKRLDTTQKSFKFYLLRHDWSVTPDLITASRNSG